MSDTVTLADGTDLEVVDDPDAAGAIVTGATVSESRKENLGDYENVEPHASVRVEFSPAIRVDDADGQDAVYAKLRPIRSVVGDHIDDRIEQVTSPREYE